MFQKYYSRFLEKNSNTVHFACHSHHYWPDVTREAHIQYWDDSAELVDDKWNKIFGEKIPTVQNQISKILNLSHPEQITFAQNSHELGYRLLSSLGRNSTILTTDSEFYSFNRQIKRLEESEHKVIYVAQEPISTFNERLINNLKINKPDMIFISHVFFNSGQKINDELIASVIENKKEDSIFALDGYHSFMATPINLKPYEENIFFLAGGYKYAQAGEGACFLYSPPNNKLRPKNTGWFAQMAELSNTKKGEVGYSNDGLKFAGSTMDFSGLYRMEAVFNLFEEEDITVSKIHKYIKKCQKSFLNEIQKYENPYINRETLIQHDLEKNHGHFLTFNIGSSSITEKIYSYLKSKGIITDYREGRLRFGFGLYHDGNYDLSVLNDLKILEK